MASERMESLMRARESLAGNRQAGSGQTVNAAQGTAEDASERVKSLMRAYEQAGRTAPAQPAQTTQTTPTQTVQTAPTQTARRVQPIFTPGEPAFSAAGAKQALNTAKAVQAARTAPGFSTPQTALGFSVAQTKRTLDAARDYAMANPNDATKKIITDRIGTIDREIADLQPKTPQEAAVRRAGQIHALGAGDGASREQNAEDALVKEKQSLQGILDGKYGAKKPDWKKVAKSMWTLGTDMFAKSVVNTLDFAASLPAQVIGMSSEDWESLGLPTTALKKWVQEYTGKNSKYYADAAGDSKAAQIAQDWGAGTVAAIPQAILYFLTGGLSAAAEGTTAGLQAASALAQGGTGTMVLQAVTRLAKDPQFWLAFTQVVGDSYESAKVDGASDVEAISQALVNGTLNALVEVGGGTQKMPTNLDGAESAFKAWRKSALEEGGEELVQGPIERLLQNLIYGKGNPLFSLTDEDAVINPITSAKEFGGGVFVGGILGAGQAGVSTAINRAARSGDMKQLGAAIREAGAADALIKEAKARGGEAAAMAQRIEGKRGKSAATDAQLGELYMQTLNQTQSTGGGGHGREGSVPENAPETAGQAQNTEGGGHGREGGIPENAAVTESNRNGTENDRNGTESARTLTESAPETTKTAPRTAENPRIGTDGTRYAPRAGEGPVVLPTAEEEMNFRLSRNAKTELERSGILAGVDRETISRAQSIADTLGRDIVFYSSSSAGENGYRDMSTGRIYINAQSKNPTMQIIAHELTHSIEGSSSYDRLKKLILGRIQQQGGDLGELRQAKAELYARHSIVLEGEESIDAEIVAEYIEKNLLTDEESIISLVSEDRTLGRRIMDFIDRILARLGNEDAQERAFLTRAREYYAKALEETPRTEPERTGTDDYLMELREQLRAGEITDEEYDRLFDEYYRGGSEGKFSIEETGDGKKYVRADRQVIYGNDPRAWSEQLEDYINGKIRRGQDVTLIGADGDELHLTATTAGKVSSIYKDGKQLSDEYLSRKFSAGAHIDELAETSRGFRNANDEGNVHASDASEGWNYRRAYFKDLDGAYYECTISVEKGSNGNVVYNIGQMKRRPFPTAPKTALNGSSAESGARRGERPSADNVSRPELSVKRKFSFAGERAKGADLEALEKAKQLREEDVAEDVILRETGWYVGADGKWRFEIDDSGMEFRRDGDARLMQEPEYKRLDELTEKWAASMESGGAPLTAAEETELEQLQEKYSDRVWDEKYLLSDFLRHDKLFEQYPMLKYMTLSFEKLDPGERGYYDRKNGKIVLDSSMLGGEKDTLIHEIQHAIQGIEGFSSGASPEYWARREYESGDLVTERLQREYDKLLNSLSKEEQNKYIRYTELDRELERLFLSDENSEDGRRYAKLEAEQDALYEELYPNKWFRDLLDLDRRMNDAPGEYLNMYRSTAGEIEARDAAGRRNLTAEERRERMPDRGDENTVFAEGTSNSFSIRRTEDIPYQEQIDAFYSGDEKTLGRSDDVFISERNAGLKKLGLGSNPFFMLKRNLKKIIRTEGRNPKYSAHGLSEDIVRRLPDIINSPALVVIGNGRVSVISDVKVETPKSKAAPLLIGIDPNSSVDGRSAYEVKSVYGKDDFANWLKLRAGDSTILAGNENKAKALLRDVGIRITEPVAYADDLTSEILSHDAKDVNSQFSVSERTPEEKKEIFRSLQGYLNGKTDARELRRYVDSLDESIDYSFREDSLGLKRPRLKTAAEEEAERIVRRAHGEGVGVEEYLRRSWDEYEVDGRLSEEARKALELERRQIRKYSQDEAGQERTQPDTGRQDDARAALPRKAQDYLRRTERTLVNRIGRAMSVPRLARRDYLEGIAREISGEYLRDGRISEETAQRLFDTAYDEGVIVDEEFYNQYKDLKDRLRTMAVTISDEDRADIADFNSFRKSAFGRLRIVNEGGTPVDVAYEELRNMAPELFPAALTHPADQLMRMFEAARSVERSEKSLDEHFGYEAEEFRRWAKNDFDAAIDDTLSELRNVRRFAEERARTEEPVTMTQEDVKQAYKQLKEARKAYEKAAAKNLLTHDDEMQVGRLLRGETELRYIDPRKNNYRGIKAVYEAKREYERYAKTIHEWNDSRRAELRKTADELLKTANSWKDKKAGILYARETMERNIYDIVKDRKLAKRIIDEYFTPVHTAQAQSTRLKNRMRDRVRKLNLSTTETKAMQREGRVSEAHAVQLIGEAADNIRMLENSRGRMKERDGKTLDDWRSIVQDLWAKNPQLDRAKIEGAVEEFRSIYDELFGMMNETRLRNGYEPVNYRKGYFPHFQPGDGDGIMGLFGRALGIDTQVTALPTTINGLTHTFRPGIQWFSGALERRGFETAYNAVEGFDRYIEGVADVIYQTDNIQKLRALATQVRYRTGDEGIKKQVDAVRADTSLSEEDRQNRIDQIYKDGRFALSNFAVELEEYTNLLANKKSRADRNMEQALGRNMYNLTKALESRVAANMVAVNVGSWLTNYIPIVQGWATLNTKDLLRGMWQTLRDMKTSDGIADASAFLTNRRGSDPLVKTWAQKTSAVLSSPMEHIDQFTAGSLVRARYNQNRRRGLSESEAMSEADSWVAGVMADRSKGSTPTLFNRRNPITKLFTQFQLEVNNQLSYLFKDMPRELLEKGVGALALALFKFCLGSWLYNEVYEYFVGRRPALDPIGILNDTVGDLTGYELPNLVELGVGAVTGDMPSFKTEKVGVGEALKNLGENAAEQVPFVGGLVGGGRIPISSALPNVGNLYKAATNEDWSAKKKLYTAGKELSKPATYLIPPFGGGQVRKIYQGLEAVIRGGSYSVDSEGNEQLQYPVYTDTPLDTAKSVVQSTLFGKTALPGGREWIDSGFKGFSAKQTAVYKGLLDAGVGQKEAYRFMKDMGELGKTDDESAATAKRAFLESSGLSGEGKSVVYYGLLASDREREAMDGLAGMGADMGAVTQTLISMKAAGDKDSAKLKALSEAGLGDEETIALAGLVMGTELVTESGAMSQYAKLKACVDAGMSATDALEAKGEGARLDKLLELTDAGLEPEAAERVALALAALEPEEGKTQVSDAQRWRAALDAAQTGEEEMNALKAVMDERQFAKLGIARDYGIDPELFVSLKEVLPQFDENENGSINSDELEAAIDAMGGGLLPAVGRLTQAQQAALWQIYTTSTDPTKNPFGVGVGRKVQKAKEAAMEEIKAREKGK